MRCMERNTSVITSTQLAAKLEEYSYSVEEFARLADLNHTTVRRFARGDEVAYRASTVRRIRNGVNKLEAFRQQMEATRGVSWQ